jgi:cupin fold WbuC family metalloprotein
LVLRGEIDFLVFDDHGEVANHLRLRANGPAFGVDLSAGRFHTFLVRAEDTVLYEIKLGPYTTQTAKDFAPWAPAESTALVTDYLASLEAKLAARC